MPSLSCRDPITHLTERERRMARWTLQKLESMHSEDCEVLELQEELQLMLCLGIKAEIQWLDESGSLTRWLERQMMAVLGVEEPLP